VVWVLAKVGLKDHGSTKGYTEGGILFTSIPVKQYFSFLFGQTMKKYPGRPPVVNHWHRRLLVMTAWLSFVSSLRAHTQY